MYIRLGRPATMAYNIYCCNVLIRAIAIKGVNCMDSCGLAKSYTVEFCLILLLTYVNHVEIRHSLFYFPQFCF